MMNPTHPLSRRKADEHIRKLSSMNTAELVCLWAALFGSACYSRRKAFIRRRLEWRINTLVSGGISERALKRAEEIADDTLLRVKSRAFRPREEKETPSQAHEIIRKSYKGVDYEVIRTRCGFLYKGNRYATLSEVSTLIAGYYVSGNKFFGLKPQKRS